MIPLPALVAMAASIGTAWGAFAGAFGGLAAMAAGSEFREGGIALGLFFGGCSGMIQLGGLFLPNLIGAVHRRTIPAVVLGVLTAPLAGWAGILALFASTLGLWLFALPPLVLAAFALERGVQRARALESPPHAALSSRTATRASPARARSFHPTSARVAR